MLDRIFPHSWMTLPASTREALCRLLNIPKTGQTEVRTEGGGTSILVSDGVTAIDLEVITVESLEAFVKPTGKDLSFPDLWTMAVRKADLTLSEVVEKPVETVDSAITGDKKENNDSEKEEIAENKDATGAAS